jgi:hypothetical protein
MPEDCGGLVVADDPVRDIQNPPARASLGSLRRSRRDQRRAEIKLDGKKRKCDARHEDDEAFEELPGNGERPDQPFRSSAESGESFRPNRQFVDVFLDRPRAGASMYFPPGPFSSRDSERYDLKIDSAVIKLS